MERLFSASPLREDGVASVARGDWLPAVDVREEADRYVVYVDLPGVKPDAVDINLQGRWLPPCGGGPRALRASFRRA
ncbi:hypothetical protein [Immundisolibacter sp.]